MPQPAIERVKALLKGNAEDREVYIALAQMYSRIKDWDNAEESINKAIELSTKSGGQAVRAVCSRLHLRAPEEVRQGRRGIPQSSGR